MCASVLRDHGAAYAQWAGEHGSGRGPHQIARAVLLMTPPFEVPSEAVRALVVPLLERGLASLERDEADHSCTAQRAKTLRAAVSQAKQQMVQLEGTVTRLQQVLQLQQQQLAAQNKAWVATLDRELAEAERRRAGQVSALQDVAAAAQNGEHALQQRAAELASSRRCSLERESADQQLISGLQEFSSQTSLNNPTRTNRHQHSHHRCPNAT